jgi:hypothetical protein
MKKAADEMSPGASTSLPSIPPSAYHCTVGIFRGRHRNNEAFVPSDPRTGYFNDPCFTEAYNPAKNS